MSLEAISIIKKAEDDAASLRLSALAEAKQKREDAARNLKADFEVFCKEETQKAEKAVAAANEAGEGETAKAKAEATGYVAFLSDRANGNMGKAIKIIIGAI